jgi:tape measure domain-containing protein
MSNTDLQYTLRLKDLFSKTMQGAHAETARLDNKMNSMSSGIGKLGGLMATAFSVSQVVNFGKAVIESYSNFEYFHAGLKTMLHGNENAANVLEQRLVTLAKTTPFELTEVQQATRQLLAYGFQAGNVVDTMKMLGDVSAGVGAPMTDIAYLYGTLKTSGRVMQVDLRQFAGRGIPIYESLAKRLRVTTAQVNQLVHDGKIGFKDVEGAFQDMTKEGGQFFNLMNDQSKTLGGQISNLIDGWEQFKVNLGTTFSENLKSTFSELSYWLTKINDDLAHSNRMQGSLRKQGVGLRYGELSDGARIKVFSEEVEKYRNMPNMSDEDKISKLNKMAMGLTVMQKRDQVLGKSDTDSNEEYLRRIAVIRGELDFYKGTKDLDGTKSLIASQGKNSTSKSSSSLGTGTEVTGNRPQNLNIHIEKLIETQEIHSTNLKESTDKIKSEVSKVLLEAVNDVNLMKR